VGGGTRGWLLPLVLWTCVAAILITAVTIKITADNRQKAAWARIGETSRAKKTATAESAATEIVDALDRSQQLMRKVNLETGDEEALALYGDLIGQLRAVDVSGCPADLRAAKADLISGLEEYRAAIRRVSQDDNASAGDVADALARLGKCVDRIVPVLKPYYRK
jgi:hypothetical protein